MVLDSYAEVHGLLTRCADNAMFPFVSQRHLFFTVVLLLLALPYQSVSQHQEAWFGTWKLVESPRYKRVLTRIEPWEDGLKVTYDMVGLRGGVTHMEWIGKFDGKDYPMQGADYVMTNAYRRLDDRSYEIAIKLDGVPSATARVTVSPDGRTLSVATTERGANGQTKTATATYEKL